MTPHAWVVVSFENQLARELRYARRPDTVNIRIAITSPNEIGVDRPGWT